MTNRSTDRLRRRPTKHSTDAAGGDSIPKHPRRRPAPIRKQHRRALMDAINGEIEPVLVTGTYQTALFVVASAMILMPLTYAALVGLLIYGVFWHATGNSAMAAHGFWGLAFYLLPLLVGPIIALSLIKPLFAGRAAHRRFRYLKPEAEPFLYQYVDRLCHAVGAPSPASIRIDCDVNASASFRRGLFSDELTLTIGLPLVYGLTVRQFSGVLSHEFGHFAQSAGMRMSDFIMRINFWFARAVYERDAWDEMLLHLYQQSSTLKPLLIIARAGVWCTRWIMWCLMMGGHIISFYLMRQMEFDADRHQARLAGSDTFPGMYRRIGALSIAEQFAFRDLSQFYQKGRLVDDLPRLIAANVDQITPELKKALAEQERKERSSLFDTHPSGPDRAASIKEENAEGLLLLPGKLENLRASILFDDVDRLSRWASLQFYKSVLGPDVKSETLYPVDDLIERRDAEKEAAKALHRYFQVCMPYFYPIPISPDANEAPENVKATARRVKASRREMLNHLDEYREITERYECTDDSLMESSAAVLLLDVGIPIKAKEFKLPRATWDSATFRHENAKLGVSTLMGRMLDFETAASERLSGASQLLCNEEFVAAIDNGDHLAEEVRTLVPEARFVSRIIGELPTMRILCHRMVILFSNLHGHEQDVDVIEAIFENMTKLHHRLIQLFRKLGKHPYPFDHVNEYMTLRDFVLSDIPDEDDPGGLLYATQSAIERLVTVQMRLFARLALVAEQVERRLGLPPLPDPKEEEDFAQKRG